MNASGDSLQNVINALSISQLFYSLNIHKFAKEARKMSNKMEIPIIRRKIRKGKMNMEMWMPSNKKMSKMKGYLL